MKLEAMQSRGVGQAAEEDLVDGSGRQQQEQPVGAAAREKAGFPWKDLAGSGCKKRWTFAYPARPASQNVQAMWIWLS